jgi:hypothetical protein
MLPLFAPLCGWTTSLEEDSVRPEQQSYVYRDTTEISESYLRVPPSDHLPQDDDDHHHRLAKSVMSFSGDPTTVKKLNHNASERDRRKKMNSLYSSLRSLLPATDHLVIFNLIVIFLPFFSLPSVIYIYIYIYIYIWEMIFTLFVHNKYYTHTRHIRVAHTLGPTPMCLVWVKLLWEWCVSIISLYIYISKMIEKHHKHNNYTHTRHIEVVVLVMFKYHFSLSLSPSIYIWKRKLFLKTKPAIIRIMAISVKLSFFF